MRFVKSLFVVLAAVFAIAVAREARAQQPDPYVSCIKCHALPLQQALAEMQGHGFPYPPEPESACTNCHDTWNHEQNPPAIPGYLLWRSWGGPGSPLANACLSCHTTLPPGHHLYDVFPYFDATPPSNPPLLAQGPTPVLPLFTPYGTPDQYTGGLVCSTCHDPHNPSYPVSGSSKFLRIGSFEQTAALCGYCHGGTYPPTTGADLFIPSDSDSVRFTLTPAGALQIDVTVQNRGNGYPSFPSGFVYWEDGTGFSLPVGPLNLYSYFPPGGETVASVLWTPTPEWTYGEGYFVFSLSPQPLLQSPYPVEFVRSMDVPPTPTNLRVTQVGIGEIHLAWDLPLSPTGPLGWEISRDGVKIAEAPVLSSPMYTDFNLAPETPHLYTVRAVRINDGLPSQQSEPVGATTAAGMVVRVPQDYPTIQAAIDASWSMTSIHVAPGTYTEPLDLSNKHGITIKGQDANGCVLDYSGGPSIAINLGYSTGQPGNTLSGFTVRNGAIMAGPGAVVSRCVIRIDNMNAGPAVMGGGLVAQCVFDTGIRPAFMIDPNRFLTSVNSIYLGSHPFDHYAPPASAALLLNNDFPSWFESWQYPGSGNFSDPPLFAAPGPPTEYFPAASPTFDRGLMLGTPFLGAAPDVGVFEFGQLYTPQPPANLIATFAATPFRHIELTWAGSIDAPVRVFEYRIFRSTTDPAFPPGLEILPYATVAAGTTFFSDYDVPAGNTYSYQVRAYAGPAVPPPTGELLSAPTNTASAGDSNNPPVAVDDVATTPENQPVSVAVLANDSDPDGDVFHILDVGYPQYGSTQLNANESIQYTPAPGFSGTDSFSYTVLDIRGGSATAYVHVTVVPGNRPPVAANDAYSTPEDTGLNITVPGVLGNDTDPDGDALEALLAAGPAHGTLTLNLDGSFSYVPSPNYRGADSFTYLAGDGQLVSAAATVTIDVTAVNDPPVASGLTVTTAEDTAVPVALAATDADGDVLIYALATGPANGTLSGVAPNLTYTPNANFNGADSFTFTASDQLVASAPATITLNVRAVNDPPVAVGDTYTAVEDTPLDVPAPGLLGNDTDVDGPALAPVLTTWPAHGSVTLNADRSFRYHPIMNYSGTDSFVYHANDGLVSSNNVTVTITVTPVLDAPVAKPQSKITEEDTPVALTLAATDADGDALTYAVAQGPTHGTLSGTAPNLTYTPALNYNGADSFTFTAGDGQLTSAPATVSIWVNLLNDPPVAISKSETTREDVSWGLAFTGTDVDPFTVLTYALVQGPAHGTLTGTMPIIRYVPAPNFFGTDSVTFTANDGEAVSNVATITITVTPVNDPPVGAADSYGTAEDTALIVPAPGVLGNDSDIEGAALSAQLEWGPGHGTLTLNADTSFTYSPAANYSGQDSFSYLANDGQAQSSHGTIVTITVTAVNDPPAANAQSVTTPEDTPFAVVLTGSDVEGAALTYAIETAPAHGTLSGTAPNLTYTPGPNYFGPESFTFKVSDGTLDSAVATVTITVTPVNDTPFANAGPDKSGVTQQVLTFDGAASSDPDGSIVDCSWNWGDGTPVSSGPGSAATHAYAAAGTYTVTLTVRDNAGATASDTATVTITAANLALNKTATASPSRSGYPPANAVDGSTSTSWMSSKSSGTQSLMVDLGTSKTISNVKVRWQSGYHAKSFKVETFNGNTWTTRFSTTSGAGGTTDVTFGPVSARNVRVSCTKAYNSSYYGILELQVYQ